MRARLIALVHLFCKGWEFWSPLPVTIAIVLVCHLIPVTPEAKWRIAGLILQLLGVSVVAVGIKHARELFGRKNYFAQACEWWRSVRALFKPIEGKVNIVEAPDTISITGLVPEIIRGGNTLEGRVLRLEDKVKAHDGRFDDLTKQLAATTNAIESRISSEQDARMQADRLTREQLEAFSVGGIYIDIAGLIWLIFCIIFATIPQELAKLWCRLTLG